MIKILIVDDDVAKVTEIVLVLLLNPDIKPEQIETCNFLVDARRFLSNKRYDLLILDLKVPNRLEDAPKEDAGEEFLKEIQNSDRLQKPFHIIGITAFDGLFQKHCGTFHHFLWHLLFFKDSGEWKDQLSLKVLYLTSSKRCIQSTSALEYDYDLAIVTAVPKLELKHVLRLTNFTQTSYLDDSTVYHNGVFSREHSDLRVVTAVAPQMGMQAASVLTLKLIERFRPRYLAVTGIVAGVPEVTNLGDIIIADQTFDYGSGKIIADINGKRSFKADPRQIALDTSLKERFIALDVNRSYLDKISSDWNGPPPKNPLNVIIGGIASGSAVVQDPKLIGTVLKSSRKVVAIDMETYGVFYAANNCRGVKPKVFSIKSVSDFGNSNKNDDYQIYAAFTSSNYLYHFACETL